MKLYENNRFCTIVNFIFLIATLCNLTSLFLKDLLPDFLLGFLEGIALVGMTFTMIHYIICLAHKKNPITGLKMK